MGRLRSGENGQQVSDIERERYDLPSVTARWKKGRWVVKILWCEEMAKMVRIHCDGLASQLLLQRLEMLLGSPNHEEEDPQAVRQAAATEAHLV